MNHDLMKTTHVGPLMGGFSIMFCRTEASKPRLHLKTLASSFSTWKNATRCPKQYSSLSDNKINRYGRTVSNENSLNIIVFDSCISATGILATLYGWPFTDESGMVYS
ncbi:hypothetical protein BD408DRAFT_413665 [Parasitella parasitica]|nr:hypothetical protein BD408DRAFT_413665 [Parasitella parasitica]